MATSLRRGFLRDSTSDVLQTTQDATLATPQGGFLRAPTGELVLTTDATSATSQGGFLRSPAGALVVTDTDLLATWQRGFLRSPVGALVVTSSGIGIEYEGFLRSTTTGALLVSTVPFGYFVSNTGSDAANGLTPATAWQTLSKVTGFTFAAGDRIALKRGDRWKETLTVPRANLTIGAYGAAPTYDAAGYGTNAPVIDGGIFVTGWGAYAGGQPDSYIEDDFAGVLGNLTTSAFEIGTGVWQSLVSTMSREGGLARRADGITTATYRASTIIGRAAYRTTAFVKIVSLDATNDIVRIFSHLNPSGQGTDKAVFMQIQFSSGAGHQVKMGNVDTTTTVVTTDTFVPTFVVGQTYKVDLEIQRTATQTLARGYIDGVLINSFDFGNTTCGTFYDVGGQTGFLLGSGTTAGGSTATGMQLESWKVEPLTGGATPTNTYVAAVASDPGLVTLSGLYSPAGEGVNLLAVGEHVWQAGNLYVRPIAVGVPSATDVIQGSLSSGIACSTRNDVTIDGIAFEHQKGSSITWSGAANNATVRNCYAQDTGVDTGGTGVFSFVGAHVSPLVENSVVRRSGTDGVWLENCTNPIVRYNRLGPFYESSADAIQVGSQAAGLTVNSYVGYNYITMAGSNSPKGGIILFGNTHLVEYNVVEDGNNFGITCPGDNFIVRYNTLRRSGKGGGVRLIDSVAHNTHSIHHNLFIDCTVAFYHGSVNYTGVTFFNNTIYNTAVAPQTTLFSGYGQGQMYFGAGAGGEFKNNILWNTSPGQSLLFSTVSGAWDSNYNLIGPESANFITFTGTQFATLAAYSAAKSQDARSLKSDPLFVNVGAGDYRLRARSPAAAAGVSLAGVNTAPFNIGAF